MKKLLFVALGILAITHNKTHCCPTCVAQLNPDKYTPAFFKREAYTRYQNGAVVEKATTVDEMLAKMRERAKKGDVQ